MAFVCAAFSAVDIDTTGRRYGFYPFLMLMMAGVNGAFLTGDIFNLYVWFEVFLISSFGLLILGSRKGADRRRGEIRILNLVATTLFLIATGLSLWQRRHAQHGRHRAKARRFARIGAADDACRAVSARLRHEGRRLSGEFLAAGLLSHAALVTAALFGGLLTKVGIYALLRSFGMIFPPERAELSGVMEWVAIATMLLGAMGALAQTDIRRMAGFLVISGVGVMLSGLAIGGTGALSGTILYAVHSMLAMAALYLLAAAICEAGGSFLLSELGGIYRASPLLTAIAFLLFLAVCSLPPGSGLWPKVILVGASIEAGRGWLAFAILLTGLLTTITLGRVFILAFWRDGEGSAAARAPSAAHLAPLIVLLVPILLLGILPEQFIRIADSAALGLTDSAAYIRAVFPEGGG